jgi:transposase
MANEKRDEGALGVAERARRANGAAPSGATVGPLGPGQRWSLARKREVALRLLRGEPVESLSREVGVEINRLAKWRDKALAGIDNGLRERDGDPLNDELEAAVKRVGELSMENELLRERCRRNDPLAFRRSKR